jgi:hypothetical protein
MFTVHGYEKAPLIFEVRGLPSKTDSKDMDKFRGEAVGVVVQYEGGHVAIPSSYNNVGVFDKSGKKIKEFKNKSGEDSHYANFIHAVRSRKYTDLNADIEQGHLSSALCHTGNISYRLGKKADPGVIHEKFKADKEATDSLDRMIEHLAANGVDVAKDQLALGEYLKMDPKKETFIGNAEASKLLTREYRAPFVVPEKV